MLIYILIIILLICLCKNHTDGFGMGGQLILPRLEQSIIYPGSSFYNPSLCKNDPEWTKGDLTCMDYSLENADCSDAGDNGTSALESCPISCDSCENNILKDVNYSENKMLERLPSPVMEGDIDLASYGIVGEMGDDINNSYAGLFSNLEDKIDDLTEEIDDLKELSALSDDLSCGCDDLELESNPYRPKECSSNIINDDFEFDLNPEGDNDQYHRIKCGNNFLKVGGDEGPELYYDCENSNFKVGVGDDYKEYDGACFDTEGGYIDETRDSCRDPNIFLRNLQKYSCNSDVIDVSFDRDEDSGQIQVGGGGGGGENTLPSPVFSSLYTTIVLDVDFSLAGLDGSVERQNFINNFQVSIADLLGVQPNQIIIINVRGGSVIVDFLVIDTSDVPMDISVLNDNLNGQLDLGTLGMVNTSTIVSPSTTPTTPPTAPPTTAPMSIAIDLENDYAAYLLQSDINGDGVIDADELAGSPPNEGLAAFISAFQTSVCDDISECTDPSTIEITTMSAQPAGGSSGEVVSEQPASGEVVSEQPAPAPAPAPCKRPTNKPEYYFDDALEENLLKDTFDVKGVICGPGYKGTVTAGSCEEPGDGEDGEYRVSGCKPYYVSESQRGWRRVVWPLFTLAATFLCVVVVFLSIVGIKNSGTPTGQPARVTAMEQFILSLFYLIIIFICTIYVGGEIWNIRGLNIFARIVFY